MRFEQSAVLAEALTRPTAGNNMAAMMAMIAITTRSSVKVKPGQGRCEKGCRSEHGNRLLKEFGAIGFMSKVILFKIS